MNRIYILWSCLFTILFSCSKEKTDYEAERLKEIPEETTFKSLFKTNTSGYELDVLAINGTCQVGFNEIHFKIKSNQTNQYIQAKAVQILPLLTESAHQFHSAPHSKLLDYNSSEQYYEGYIVFTRLSTGQAVWQLLFQIEVDQKLLQLKQTIQVEEQTNKNLGIVHFSAADQTDYLIALLAPKSPKVAENKLLAGIFQLHKEQEIINPDFSSIQLSPYQIANSYQLLLDPRMPEPSMGNHSSPNNKDLKQGADGWYEGVVNYTMTGNWTLNFILQNAAGKILKGTTVPKDFTPGIAGQKSELFIDILF